MKQEPGPPSSVPGHWLSFRWALFCSFAVIFLGLAVSPFNRADWMLENALTLVLLIAFVATWRTFCFSPASNTLLFFFLCLHAVGAHYTYSNVPIDAWWTGIFGWSLNEALNLSRNHYDRFVHFCFGLLLIFPLRELLVRQTDVPIRWCTAFAATTLLAASMSYELIEWIAAEFLGGDLGHAYVGAQGDIWDAQKDMALATLGCLIGIALATGAMSNKHGRQRRTNVS